MKNRRHLRLLALSALPALTFLASCEPLDTKAATRNPGWNGVLTDHLEPGDREIFTDIDETVAVPTPCDKTSMDAHSILSNHCGACHNAGAASQGVPVFDFLMDDAKLISEPWVRQTGGNLHFVIPGDPDNSQIYVRAAILQNMPPQYMNIATPDPPRMPYSEAGVVREWITNCMAGGPVASGTGGGTGTTATATTTGTGGAGGTN
jgi:hypothetical protein